MSCLHAMSTFEGVAQKEACYCCSFLWKSGAPPRIEKEGLTEKTIILCKLNKSLLESYIGKKVCIT